MKETEKHCSFPLDHKAYGKVSLARQILELQQVKSPERMVTIVPFTYPSELFTLQQYPGKLYVARDFTGAGDR